MTEQFVEDIRQFDLFKNLPEDALEKLSARFTRVILKPEQVLFDKGDQGDAFYIVQSGHVKMVGTDSEGKEVVFNQVGAGAVIGEMALLDGAPRSAGVIALSDVAMLRLSTEDFLDSIQSHPDISLEISRGLIQRLRFATTYIENAIEWSQLIAKGDYSFIEGLDQEVIDEGEGGDQSDQERAQRFLGTFFQMVENIKAREDELKQQLVKLQVEIDQTKRKRDVDEIAQSEFFKKLKEQRTSEKEQKTGD